MSGGKFKHDEAGLLVVFMEPGESVSLDEFHTWYDSEHVPLRIQRFPSFRSAVRYAVTSTTTSSNDGEVARTSWGAIYTVSTNAVFDDVAYTSLRSQRSAREAELFTRLAVVDRRIYRLEYDSDTDPTIASPHPLALEPQRAKDTPKYMVCNSVDVNPDVEDEFNKWWQHEHVPMLAKVPGWKRSRRFTLIDNAVNGTLAQPLHATAVPKNLGLHEYDTDNVESTPEFKAAASTDWRKRVVGPDNANILRRERKTCSLYRAWDPTAALENP